MHLLLKILIFIVPAFLWSQRTVENWNSNWEFLKNENFQSDSKEWEKIQIPHTWNLDAYQVRDYYRGTCWYRKFFDEPDLKPNQVLYLKFEAINSYAEIYLNNQLLQQHSGGYSSFNVLIPKDILKPTKNEIRVMVNNENSDIPPLSGDFTIFGGIYRDVHLITLNDLHFDMENYGSNGVFINTEINNEAEAILSFSINLSKNPNPNSRLFIELSHQGNLVNSFMVPLKKAQFNIENILIQNPKLWSPEEPNLYQAKFQLIENKIVTDEIDLNFGIRWFSVDSEKGFELNGKPIKLMGTNRHQDQFPYGIAVPKSVHLQDLKLIKEMGANFVRLAHYPQAQEVLKLCDSLGLMVWEEIPVVDIISPTENFKTNAENQLKEMVRQHYNHPSVIFWGYMNEPIIQVQYRLKVEEKPAFYQKTVELAHHLEKLLKAEDSSRLSAIAFHGTELYNEVGLNGIADISGWNLYQGWYGGPLTEFEEFIDNQHIKHPNTPIFISEFGAGSDARLHSLNPETFDFSIEYQQKFLEHYLPEIMKRDYIIGSTEWNFIDFNVATRQESMPRTNNKGLVYNNRKPKDVYYYFKAFLRKDTLVAHLAVDDWKKRMAVTDKQTASFPIKLYTNLPKASLQVNGVKYPLQEQNNFHMIWQIPLNAGKNTIQAFDQNGKLCDEAEIELQIQPKNLLKSNQKVDLAINVGSNCDFWDEENQITYLADQAYEEQSWGYKDGNIYRKSPGRIGTTAEVFATKNTPLFQTQREDLTHYQIDLPNGFYVVELGFANLYEESQTLAYDLSKKSENQSQSSVFQVNINGNPLFAKNSSELIKSSHKAYFIKTQVKVENSRLVFQFLPINGKTFLNSIRVYSLA